MNDEEIKKYADEHGLTVEHVKNTQSLVVEALRRNFGNPTMSDDEFKKLNERFNAGITPKPDTLENKFETLEYCWKELKVGLMAIMPLIDKPYPDDKRWTPYTFLLERYVKGVDEMIPKIKQNILKPHQTNKGEA